METIQRFRGCLLGLAFGDALAAYEFTSSDIACALLAAQRRAADVQVILDPAQRHQHGGQAGLLPINKIPVLYDPAHTIFHDKYMVIDSHLVLTGSFNYTPTAEFHNAENFIFVDSPHIAALYTANWLAHKAHSVPELQTIARPLKSGPPRSPASLCTTA